MYLNDDPCSHTPRHNPSDFDDPTSQVPKGLYCYWIIDVDQYRLKINPCPFWGRDGTKDFQEGGYCLLTGIRDWEEDRLSLLWDMVKECEHNPGDIDDLHDYQE